MTCPALLLTLMVLATPAPPTEARASTVDGARFAVRASFQPEPKAVANDRHSLRGRLAREAQAAIQGLNAKLEIENAALRDELADLRADLAALRELLSPALSPEVH
jgi:hypothetical protein